MTREEARDRESVEWRTEMRADIEEIKDRVNGVHARVDEALIALAAGNPEIHPGAMDPKPRGD